MTQGDTGGNAEDRSGDKQVLYPGRSKAIAPAAMAPPVTAPMDQMAWKELGE